MVKLVKPAQFKSLLTAFTDLLAELSRFEFAKRMTTSQNEGLTSFRWACRPASEISAHLNWIPNKMQPPPSNPYSSQGDSFQDPPKPGAASEGDSTGGLIPYKNPSALLGYYISIGSMFPCLGLPLSIVAIYLGVKGFRYRAKNPIVKGGAHAGIAIGLGAFTLAYNLPLTVLSVMGLIAGILESNGTL